MCDCLVQIVNHNNNIIILMKIRLILINIMMIIIKLLFNLLLYFTQPVEKIKTNVKYKRKYIKNATNKSLCVWDLGTNHKYKWLYSISTLKIIIYFDHVRCWNNVNLFILIIIANVVQYFNFLYFFFLNVLALKKLFSNYSLYRNSIFL